jgi:tetratricopeptide (TPR) repeat protein
MTATPFVNREDELEFLGFARKRAEAGQGQVVAIVGDAGVGKSRLLSEFSRHATEGGWHALVADAPPGGELTSYLGVTQILRSYFALDERDPAAAAAELVTTTLAARDDTLKGALPAILAVLDLPVPGPSWPTLDASLKRQRILDAVADVILRESQERPLLIAFENLHWIDPETQACLDALVDRLPRSRVLLVASHRPEYTPPWGSFPYYNPLRLGPLSGEAAEAMLTALLGAEPRLAAVTRVLVEHTGGNPLFLEECVRVLADADPLADGRGAGDAQPLGELLGLATVQAVLASRLRRLPADDQRLLEAASVIGSRVAMPVLEAATGLPSAALTSSLGRLESAGLLHESGPFPGIEVSFTHPLMHEVTYGGLMPEGRRALHAATLAALEGLGPQHLAARPDVLGEHALRGQRWDKAVVYLRQAGARATSRAANGEAVARLEQALTALSRQAESRQTLELAIDLRLDLRPPLLQLGRLADVLEVSRQAEDLARRIADEPRLARVYTYLANYHYLKGEPEAAIDYGERCVAIGEAERDPALVALARAYMGYSYHAQGRYREAEDVLAENLAMLASLRPAESSTQTAVSHVGSAAWLAFTLADTGEFDRAEASAKVARTIAEESRNPYGQAIAGTLSGLVWLARGHLDRGLPLLEASLATCREKQLVVWQPIPSALVGVALARTGRAAQALPLLEDAVARTQRLGVKAYLARWTAHLGEALLTAGRVDAARETAEEALRLALTHRERGHEAESLRLLGEVAAAASPAEAERRLGEALALAETLSMEPLVAHCRLALGKVSRQAGDMPRAGAHLGRAVELCQAMDLRLWLEQARAEIARL